MHKISLKDLEKKAKNIYFQALIQLQVLGKMVQLFITVLQKKIVGLLIKKIGTAARVDIENLVSRKVYINLWVKVRKGWRDDLSFLEPVDLKG